MHPSIHAHLLVAQTAGQHQPRRGSHGNPGLGVQWTGCSIPATSLDLATKSQTTRRYTDPDTETDPVQRSCITPGAVMVQITGCLYHLCWYIYLFVPALLCSGSISGVVEKMPVGPRVTKEEFMHALGLSPQDEPYYRAMRACIPPIPPPKSLHPPPQATNKPQRTKQSTSTTS